MPEENLSDIREKKKEQIKKQMEGRQGKEREMREKQKQKAEAMKKRVLKKILTPEARERLGRIRAANQEKAERIEKLLIKLYQSGRISKDQKITDERLKQVLKKLSSGKKEINIKRK